MIYHTIPHTDLRASSICLGTASYGAKISKTEAFRLLDVFTSLGGSFLDTSLNYAQGLSEQTIGEWMKQRNHRDRIIVGTKGGCPMPGGAFFRLRRQDLQSDLQLSLRHLQTDYIDLYWLHRDDPAVPVQEIIDFLDEQAEVGKIRYFGCSNWSVRRIEEARQYAQRAGKRFFCANQMMWSLAQPNEEHMADQTLYWMDSDTMSYHRRTGMAAAPFSAQAGGFFSGAYRRGDTAPRKLSVFKLYGNELNFGRLERTLEVAASMGIASVTVALAYLFTHPFVVYPIIGSYTPQQLEESCAAGGLRLDKATVKYIKSG